MPSANASVRARRRSSLRRGISFLYVMVMMIVLIAFVAFAVDVGRMRLARSQLQAAADAAARAGAAGLPFSTSATDSQAMTIASSNNCLGDPVTLDETNDISLGIWHPTDRSFAALPGDRLREANAVWIKTRRTTARGNPIRLYFAAVLGISRNDIENQAIAYIKGNPSNGYGLVGLDFISMTGNQARVDGYDPSKGAYNPDNLVPNGGSIASNGDISLNNSNVYGDVRAGGDINGKNNTLITGWQAPLDTPLSFPPATLPAGAQLLSPTYFEPKNVLLNQSGGGSVSFPANYSFPYNLTDDKGNHTISVNGYVALYVNGDLKIDGTSVIASEPIQLRIYVIGNHTVTIGGNVSQSFELYAPQSDVTINGNPDFFGSIIAKSITIPGNARVHYDQSNAFGPLSKYQIALVR